MHKLGCNSSVADVQWTARGTRPNECDDDRAKFETGSALHEWTEHFVSSFAQHGAESAAN